MDAAHVALQSIGRAISDLSKPIGIGIETSPLGTVTQDFYPTGLRTPQMLGSPPHMWPEVIAVTEALIGAAFVVAQAHLKATGVSRPDIEGVANYWKHRDEWGHPWGSGTGSPWKSTLNTITKLKAIPPVVPGQMRQLANAALGATPDAVFDVDLLWAAIA